MQDNTKIYFWSPYTGSVGTVKNVLNTAYSLVKFSKEKIFEISLINVFGEWNFAKKNFLKRNILIKDFYNIVYTFIKNFKKRKTKIFKRSFAYNRAIHII